MPEYRITTHCYWHKDKGKGRKESTETIWHHWIEIENIKTGYKRKLKNGSIIKIVKERR